MQTNFATIKTSRKKDIRHARLEIQPDDYTSLQRVATKNGLSVAAYIRQAVLRQVRRDAAEISAA